MNLHLVPIEPSAVVPVGLFVAAHALLDMWAARGKAVKAGWLERFDLLRPLFVNGALFMTICLPFGLSVALAAQLAMFPSRDVAARLLGHEPEPLAPGVVAGSIVIVAVLTSGKPDYLRIALYLIGIASMFAAARRDRALPFERNALAAMESAQLDRSAHSWLGAVFVAGGLTIVAVSEAVWLSAGSSVWVWLYAFRSLFMTFVAGLFVYRPSLRRRRRGVGATPPAPACPCPRRWRSHSPTGCWDAASS